VIVITMLRYLWSYNSFNHWLIAISVLNINTVVKILVTLAVYTLFLIDAYRTTFWEKLDDYVYYTKLFGHNVVFVILKMNFIIL